MARVLVVDDSMFYCLALRSILEDAGHTVVGVACNVQDAIKRYEDLRPDLMTLDVMMAPPADAKVRETSVGQEGLVVLFELRRRDPKAVVIMVTSATDAAIQNRAATMGASGFIEKPFKAAEIRQAVERALAARR